jgi:hypothetical protein
MTTSQTNSILATPALDPSWAHRLDDLERHIPVASRNASVVYADSIAAQKAARRKELGGWCLMGLAFGVLATPILLFLPNVSVTAAAVTAAAIAVFGVVMASRTLPQDHEIEDLARAQAYPRLAYAEELEKVEPLIRYSPEVAAVVESWLAHGDLTIAEYRLLESAQRVAERCGRGTAEDAARAAASAKVREAIHASRA